jgi:PAS domain S-box-containing protein
LKHSIRIVAIAAAAVLVLGVGLHLSLLRGEILRNGEAEAAKLSDALSEYTRQTISGLDLALIGLEATLEAQPSGTAATLGDALNERQDASINTLAYFVLDASGRLAASSGTVPWTQDLAFLDSFVAQREQSDRGLFIGPPRNDLAGPLAGQRVVLLSRRLDATDGSFNGMVVAALSIERLQQFQQTLLVGANATVGLVSAEGIVLVRTPSAEPVFGQNISSGAMFARLAQAPRGVYVAPAITDGVSRITAYERLDRYPLVTYVAIAEADRLGQWTMLAIAESLLALLVLATMAAAMRFAQQTYSQRELLAEIRREWLKTIAAATASLIAASESDDVRRRLAEGIAEIVPGATARVYLLADGQASTQEPVSGTGGRQSVPLRRADGREIGALEAAPPPGQAFDEDASWALDHLGFVAGLVLDRLEAESQRQLALRNAETDRLEAERARSQIDEVYSSMTDAVVAFDRDWYILYVNPATTRLTQRGAEKLVGQSVWELFPDLLGTPFETEVRSASSQRRRATFEFQYARARLFFAVSAFPQELGMTVYLRDITAQKEVEAQLRQSQRMEAVGQLTGGVAHDFNNLLTVIIGNVDEIVDDSQTTPAIRSQARMVLKAAERAAELTQRLLAFSRRQALDPRSVDVNQLVGQLQDLLHRTIGESIEIAFVLEPKLDLAMVDAGQLDSAILNLAINSQHAMPKGGKLTIETANVYLDRDYALSHAEVQPGRYVLVSVTDTGVGMSRGTVERAFEPFFTTKPAGLGTGLGLSMIYGFIKQSRGHVSIYSEPGHGTTVRLYLPRAGTDAEIAGPREDPGLAPRGSENVLLVEDDELVRRHAEATLQGLGYRVTAVESGAEALAAIGEGGPFALLLVDVVLTGGMNGRQVAEAAASLAPNMKVLYMSGYTENAIVHHGRLDQGVHLLGKPFRRAELANKVRAVIDQ